MERGRWGGGGGEGNRGVESGIGEDRGLRSDRGRGRGTRITSLAPFRTERGRRAGGDVSPVSLVSRRLGVSVSRGKREEEGRQRGRDMIRR